MNCYDFDKTIYKKDSTKQLLLFAIKQKPILIFYAIKICFFALLYFFKIIDLKKFKQVFFGFLKKFDNKQDLIAKFWVKNKSLINTWYLQQMRADDVICSASPRFLVEPIMKEINPNCTVVCTEMNLTDFAIAGDNLKGEHKCEKLNNLGYTNFEAAYSDSLTDLPLLDMANNKYLVCDEKCYVFGKQKLNFFQKLKWFFKELRVKHYVKNGLIFLPLVFSGLLFSNHLKYLVSCIWGFVAFCFVASTIYIINDLVDVKKDRKHPKKRSRPYAAYMLNKFDMFLLLAVLLGAVALIWALTLKHNLVVILVLVGYLILNLLYSFWLKNLPIIDIFVLASCYVVRVYFGAFIVGVSVSKWLYLTIICVSLYLGLGKRRGEAMLSNSNETRNVNKKYTYNFLDKNMYMCLTMCVIFYSLWVVEFRVISMPFVNSLLFLATIPLVIFIFMKYSLNIEKNQAYSDPIEVFFHDFVLVLSVVTFVAMLIVAIYLPISINIVGGGF